MPPKSSNPMTDFVFLPFLPWLILCLGLAITYIAQGITQQHAKAVMQEEFNFRFNEIIANIESRLTGYKSVLSGAAGLFVASQAVDRNEFRKYVSALNLERSYPGIQGVGYSLALIPGDKDRHMEEIRREGFARYAIRPEGVREIYTAIIYLEPFDWRNQRAFGYDMYSEPTRRAAMERARDENRAIVSGKVKLAQETEKDTQAGFLMYVPVYRNNAPHETLVQRRANLLGWTYSPFRINDLMRGILGKHFGEVSGALDLEIYDGDTPSAESLMYNTNGATEFSAASLRPVFQSARTINVGGHDWTIAVSSLPGFESRLKSGRARLVMIAGIAISLLLAWVVWLLINGRSRALALATSMTRELSASESHLKALFEHMSSGVAVYAAAADGEDFFLVAFNRVAENIGKIHPALLGKSVREVFPDSAETGLLDALRRVWKSGVAERFSASFYGDGHIAGWCDNHVYKLPDGTVVAICDDVTERRLAQAALLKSFQEIEDLYQNAPCGYHSLDKDGIFLLINDTELSWLGYTREEIVGRTRFADVMSAASAQTFLDDYPTFMQRGWIKDREYEIVRKDGTVLPVLISSTAIRDGDGNYLMSRATMFDITERKRAEQALLASERHTRQLLGNLPVGVVVYDPDGAVSYINAAAQAFFKLSSEAARGRAMPDFALRFLRKDGSAMPTDELPERKVLAGRLPLKNYVVGAVVNEQEETRWALVNAFPDFDGNGAIRQVVVSFVDITERVLANTQLRSARAELEQILNVNPAATYQVKQGNNSTFFLSKGIADMVGYAAEDWLEPGFWVSHIHPDDRKKVLMTQSQLRDIGTLQHEYRFRHQDGRITARKRAELALLASERHTRQLLGNLPVGVVVYAPDGAVRYINAAAQAFFKLSSEAARDRAMPDFALRFLREDGSAMSTDELPERKVLGGRQPLKNYVVGAVVNEQEEIRWALVNAFPDFDGNGVIRQVVVSFVDITERVLANTQLRSARAELEHILNVNPAATYQVKLGTNSTFFRSKGIVDMVGYAVDDWLEPGFWVSHIHPDDKEKVLMAQNQLRDIGTLQHEYRFRHQDGRWVWILDRVNLVHDQNGEALELVGAWLDITPRKQAEIGMENLNRSYSVLSRINEAIVRTAEQNALFENICRIAVENGEFIMAWIGMVDEKKGEIFPAACWGHEAGYLDYLQSVGVLGFDGPTGQAIKNGEFRISQDIAADPHMAPWRQEALDRGYHSSAAFPLSLGGKVVGAINLYAGQPDSFDADVLRLLNDLSADVSFALGALDQQERRQAAEERLRQLNEELEQRVAERTWQLEAANKELEAFSYSVSHDLRAPLRSIDGFSEILEKRYAERLDDTGRDYLGRVRRASKRMGELIDDLLLLARVTRAELRKEPVDLSRMVQVMAREMQEAEPQRQVEWVIQDGIVAQADSRLIKVVLENLLGNAWKFTAHQTAPRVEFGMIEREDEKIIFMRDNGAGFDMQYAGKLFGAFQRLHKAEEFEGTGIGLATVQRIIHRHGGRVWAEGQTGAGATFYFAI